MVPATEGSTSIRRTTADGRGGGSGNENLLELLSECVKNLEAKGNGQFSTSASTITGSSSTPLKPCLITTAAAGEICISRSSGNAAAGNRFDFMRPPPPPQAIPLSASSLTPFATSSISVPRPPPPPHLLLPSSDSPISSPSAAAASAAGIHPSLLHSPRKSPPSLSPSPRKSPISKPRSKRSNHKSLAAAAPACPKILVANEANFKSIVEQHTAKPTSPAASAHQLPSSASSSLPPLLLEYSAPQQTSPFQTNLNPIAFADLSLLQTPDSTLLLPHNLFNFDGGVSFPFEDDYRLNSGGYDVPAAEWSQMQSGGAPNCFEYGEASLNETTTSVWEQR